MAQVGDFQKIAGAESSGRRLLGIPHCCRHNGECELERLPSRLRLPQPLGNQQLRIEAGFTLDHRDHVGHASGFATVG